MHIAVLWKIKIPGQTSTTLNRKTANKNRRKDSSFKTKKEKGMSGRNLLFNTQRREKKKTKENKKAKAHDGPFERERNWRCWEET